ncbi:MAG: type II secretion system F family protein, partial [Pseudomonadota bacterium]
SSHNSLSSLSYQLRADMFTHLATMEKAGLPTDKSFASLKLPAPATSRVEVARKLLARGKDIATAGLQSGLFNELEVHLVRAAASAGSPAPTYKRLAETYTQKARQAKAIKSRMTLPLAIFTLSLFIQPLPAFITGSMTSAAYLWSCLRPILFLLGCYALFKVFIAWLNSSAPPAIRHALENRLTTIPIFGVMHVRRNARDFFESLGLMLEAGIAMFDALPKACQTISNQLIRSEFDGILVKMKKGATLAEALADVNFLGERQVIEMVRTGESSGTLPEMLWRHANMETEAVRHFQQQVADWIPRIVYGAVMLWMAYSILTSGAFMPHVPDELR